MIIEVDFAAASRAMDQLGRDYAFAHNASTLAYVYRNENGLYSADQRREHFRVFLAEWCVPAFNELPTDGKRALCVQMLARTHNFWMKNDQNVDL